MTTCPASGPLLSVSYFLWPVGLQLGIFYSVLCPWPPQALQAEISGNSKEQIPFLPSRDIGRSSWDFCLGRYARPGECFPCHYMKSQRLWSKASAVLYLSVAWEMLAVRSKCGLFFMWGGFQCLEGTRYLVATWKKAGCLIQVHECLMHFPKLSCFCMFRSQDLIRSYRALYFMGRWSRIENMGLF